MDWLRDPNRRRRGVLAIEREPETVQGLQDLTAAAIDGIRDASIGCLPAGPRPAGRDQAGSVHRGFLETPTEMENTED